MCGLYSSGNFFDAKKCAVWFAKSEEFKKWNVDKSNGKLLYYLTISVFASINYWCWHDAPLNITFNIDNLHSVLCYKINIDWDSYETNTWMSKL